MAPTKAYMARTLAIMMLVAAAITSSVEASCPSGSSHFATTTFNINDMCAHSDNCYVCNSNWCRNYGYYCKIGYAYMSGNNYLTRVKKSAFGSSTMPSGKVLASWYGTAMIPYRYYARTLSMSVNKQDNEVIGEISWSAAGCSWCCKTDVPMTGTMTKDLVNGVEGWTRGEDFKLLLWVNQWSYISGMTVKWCYANRQCPEGQYLANNVCNNCPAGKYRSSTGGSGSSSCSNCPAGTYGSSTGLSTNACSGLCQPGYYCPAGSTSERQVKCPAGKYGEDYGLTSSNCNGNCLAGYQCPAASSSATHQLCRAGYYGVSGGNYLDDTCAGKCSAGYYCTAGSSSATQNACPSDSKYFCPAGSPEPEEVRDGYKPTANKQDEVACDPGYWCKDGVQTKCGAGRYGGTSGLSTSACSGLCQAGYFCPQGSVSIRQEKCGDPAKAPSACVNDPAMCYCKEGTTSREVITDEAAQYTTPKDAPEDRREDVDVCPSTNTCEAGKVLASSEWNNCADGSTSRTINENTSGTQTVGVPLSVTKSSTFSIVSTTKPSGCNIGSFSVTGSAASGGGSNAQLKVTTSASSPLDYEKCPYYIVRLKADDGMDSISCDVTVNVIDLNDAPSITNCADREVDETAEELESVGDAFLVSDPDRGQIGTWQITSMTPTGPFKVNPCTGQLQVTDATLNYESTTEYSVTLRVTDDGDTQLSDTCNMKVKVKDANDPPTMDDKSVTVSETASVGTTVTTMSATDPEGGTITYRLSADDPSGFRAFTVSSGGAIKVASSSSGGSYLNYEDKLRWTLKVEAEDNGGLKTTATVTIEVSDANDKPRMTGTSLFVQESQTSGTFGNRLSATDEDPSDSSSISFEFYGASPSVFSLSSNGQFSVAQALDYETTNEYTFQVRAKDAGGPGSTSAYSDPVDITVVIGDVNEAPSFASSSTTMTLPESTPVGDTFGTAFSASDPDNLQTLVYKVLPPDSGVDGSSFFAIAALDGDLSVKKALDFETQTTYKIKVQVKDNHGSPLTDTIDVTITVTDVNEPPTFTDVTRSVPENSPAGTNVGAVVSGSDEDAGDTSLTYAITSGNEDSTFSIDANSGQIKVLKSIKLDFEGQSSRSLTIRVRDDGNAEGFGKVTVLITDVNEAPVFLVRADVYEGVLPEESPADTNVGSRVEAYDQDEGQTLTFSITGGDPNNYFKINSLGQVQAAKTLPDSTNSFNLELTVTDDGSPQQSGTATMEVLLTNTNQPPTISATSRTISEAASLNSPVGAKIAASDPDPGETATLTYALELDGNPSGAFAINANSGQITVAGSLDYETLSQYELRVTVTDHPTSPDPEIAPAPSLTATAVVTVTLTNANEAPWLNDLTFSIAENSAVDDVVGTITGGDYDAGDSLSYSITSSDDPTNTFKIVGDKLKVAKASLNYEQRQLYSLNVRVRDAAGLTGSGTVTVRVTDLNEGPKFPLSLPSIYVPENTAAFSTVGSKVTATDQDGDSLSYTVTSGGAMFDIDYTSGQLQLLKAVNYEGTDSYSVTIQVSDGEYVDSGTVQVFITDVNEAPVLSASSASVAENTGPGVKVTTVAVADPDAYDNSWNFAIVGGNDGDAFSIDGSGNLFTKTKAALNWEEKSSFTLRVVATDAGGLSGNVEFDVIVTDENEPPVLASVTTSVPEDAVAGTTVATLSVTDPDQSESHVYSLVSTSSVFRITSNVIQTTGSGLNYEAQTSYTLTMKVTDKGGLTSIATAVIHVEDVNEPPTLADGSRSIEENSAVLSVVGDPVVGSDVDKNQVLTYSLVGHGDRIFKIDACSGQIQVNKDVLDSEGTNTYTLTVEVKDDGLGQLTDTATYTITVLNVNEPPTLADYILSVPENSLEDVNVGAPVVGRDEDGDDLSYTIIAGNEGSAFKIVTTASGGQIKVNKPILNYEVHPSTYTLTVQVTDNGAGALFGTGKVVVNLQDVNEAPVFNPTTVSVQENSGVGTFIGAPLACSDVDAPKTSKPLTYSIVTTGTPFSISSGGQLTVGTASLDHETQASWVIECKCVDDDPTNPKHDTATITVVITNQNEAPVLNDGALTIAENSPAGAPVGSPIKGTDVDVGQSLSYNIDYQSVPGMFRIAALTGQLEVSNPVLDFETEPLFYTLRIIAKDNGDLTDTATFTVTVTDAQEAPVMPTGEEREIVENSLVGTLIGGPIMAADPDAGGSIGYSIAGGNNLGLFRISSGGQLAVDRAELNYENAKFYDLQITATDNTGLKDTKTVRVNVQDQNERPAFDASSFSFSVAENAEQNSVIGTTVANDVDAGDVLTYSISSTDAGSLFAIKSDTGALYKTTTAANKLDLKTYVLTVSVADASGLTALVPVSVTVVDSNDAPVMTDTSRSVNENAVIGTKVGAPVTGTDVDVGQTLTYAIIDGNHNDAFKIDSSTGQITVGAAVLNYEARSSYSLVVRAADNGPGELTDSCTVTVTLVDRPEAPTMHATVLSIIEMSVIGSEVGVVTASDPDVGDSLTFAIKNGNAGTAFLVNSVTGQITVKNQVLNFETGPSYTLEMEVTDSTGLKSTANTVITITDDNDAPVLSDAAFNVAENSVSGTLVGVLSSTDEDSTQTTTFTIESGNVGDAFAVQSSGRQAAQLVVQTPSALNFESRTSYTLTIKAEDDGGGRPTKSDTATVTVTVLDQNEHPVFAASSYERHVMENSVAGLPLAGDLITATDVDAGQTLSYHLAGGSEIFDVNSVSGQITVKSAVLDHETKPEYALTLVVRDNGPGTLESSTTVVVVVDDQNEAPVIADATRSVPEIVDGATTPVGTLVGTPIVATDVDDGDELTFSITTANFNTFAIDEETGQLSVNQATLNYETKKSYTFTVQVSDGALTDSATITVMIEDVNEPPVINDATRDVDENSFSGTLIGLPLPASDVDEGQLLIFTIDAGNAGSRFKIDPCNGQLMVNKELFDHEADSSFTLTIRVTDNGDPQLHDTATITVNVLDVNEHPELADTFVTVEENSAVNVEFGDPITGTDIDDGQSLTYTIAAGNDEGTFAIVPTTGQLKVATASIDYERRSSYVITVKATDNGTPKLSATAAITVRVQDMNEAPNFIATDRSVVESATANFLVGTPVTGSDVDAHSVLTYSIVSTGHPFAVHPSTGQLTVASPPLDYETTNSYSLMMGCSDGALTTFALVTVLVEDVNEAPVMPDYPNAEVATVAVDENTARAVVATVVGSDVDGGQKLSYFIESGDPLGLFFIDRNTAELSVKDVPLDHEVKAEYKLTISVVDDGAGALRDTGIVTVTVNDLNDAPTFPAMSNRAIAENSGEDTSAGNPVVGADEDDGDSITYSITGGSGINYFAIDENDGRIYVKAGAPTLNFEATPSLSVTVKATDSGGLTASGTVLISLTDQNEAPVFADQTRSIREKVPINTVVGAPLSISDVDAGDSHTFLILGGNDNGHFKLQGTTSQLLVNGNLDNQQQSTYTLSIRAIDSGGAMVDASVVISVFDQNDPPVVSDHTFNINENSGVNTNVGTPVTGTDPEGQTLTYQIIAGNTDDVFSINAETAQIKVAKDLLDYETRTKYTLTVQTTDDGLGSMSSSSKVTVFINDVNEHPIYSDMGRSVNENVGVGALVGEPITATDVDAGAAGQMTYSIVSGNTGQIFSLDPGTAQLSVFSATLDYEKVSSYDLVVRATDIGSPRLSVDAKVTVIINDLNDKPRLDDITITTQENRKKDATIGSPLVGFDQDRDSYLTYTLTGVNCWAVNSGVIRYAYHFIDQAILTEPKAVTFSLKADDNAILGLFVDREDVDNMYEITISNTASTIARGSRGPAVASETTSDLVTDTEYRQFWFRYTKATGLLEVGTGSIVGSSVIISFTDPSPLDVSIMGASTAGSGADFTSVCFSLGGGLKNAAQVFDLQTGNGQLKMRSDGLDYETNRFYSFQVTVTDDGAGTLTDTAIVRVDVTDVNEAPTFNDDCPSSVEGVVGCFEIAELSPVGTKVTSTNGAAMYPNGVGGSDPDVLDGQTVKYTLYTTGNVDRAFTINELTGEISVNADVLDHEGPQPSYTLQVGITDSFPNPIETRATVVVTVTDVNEAPIIEDTVRTIRESTDTSVDIDDDSSLVGTLVGAPLESTDVDDPTLAIGQRTYAITAGDENSIFSIDSATGQMQLEQAILNFEDDALNKFVLTVEVTDGGDLKDSAQITIQVLNVNEPPVIEDAVRSVWENSEVGFLVGDPIPSSDVDFGQTLTYSMTGGDGIGVFKVSPCSGQIEVLSDVLNYEMKDTYTLVITVTDDGLDPLRLTDSAVVTLNIVNINERPNIEDATRNVDENKPIGTAVGVAIPATDPDNVPANLNPDTLTFTIEGGNDLGLFSIDPLTGLVSVAKAELDYETRTQYKLVVKVTDDGKFPDTMTDLFDDCFVTININDVNEAPTIADTTRSIKENVGAGTAVGLPIVAQDVEVAAGRQTLTFSILSGNDANMFVINPSTGQLSAANGNLDHEGTAEYILTIKVQDDGPGTLSGTGLVTISVLNVNEPPTITDSAREVFENVKLGTTLGLPIPHNDPENLALAFKITSGDANNLFAIDSDGQLSVRDPQINFEANPVFTLTIQVTDAGDLGVNKLTDSATVVVTVKNVNEDPVMGSFVVTVPENSGTDHPVGSPVAGTDVDAGDTAGLVYTLTNPEGVSSFAVDASTGQISVAVADLNYETRKEYVVQVTCTDSGGLSSTAPTTVKVLDVNEAPTVSTPGLFSAHEQARVGDQVCSTIGEATVCAVSGSDVDAGDSVTYSVIDSKACATISTPVESCTSEPGAFTVDSQSGLVIVSNNQTASFRSPATFRLTVQVTDVAGLTGNVEVVVEMSNVNLNPRLSAKSFSIEENSAVDTLIPGLIIGTDSDLDDQGNPDKLTYTIEKVSPPANFFKIVNYPTDGAGKAQLAVATAGLDFETSAVYAVTVGVADDGVPSKGTTATMTVSVIDVNERPTIAAQTRSIDENSAAGTPCGEPLIANDVDTADTLAYSIASRDGSAHPFVVDEATGQLSVGTASLDFETKSSYALTVTVSDGQLDASADLDVAVNNVNEVPVIAPQTFSIEENSDRDVVVGMVIASDEDALTAGLTTELTYRLSVSDKTTNDADTVFQVNLETGELSVKRAALDFEDKESYTMTIKVTDNGLGGTEKLSASATITVNLIDINDLRIDGFSLGDPNVQPNVEFPTAGDTWVYMIGANMGKTDNKAAPPAISATYQTVINGVELGQLYTSSECVVASANTRVACKTVPGVGQSLKWTLTVGQWTAESPVTTSYAAPVLTDVSNATALPTRGEVPFQLHGTNFGPVGTTPIRLQYQPKDVTMVYTVSRCTVVVAHTVVECIAAPGIGRTLKFTLTVPFTPAARVSAPASFAAASYATPTVTGIASQVRGVSNPLGLNTAGGERLRINGTNFGPTSAGYVTAVYGPDGRFGAFRASNCKVVTPHTQIECSTTAGVGKVHQWTVTVAGIASAPSAAPVAGVGGVVTSYKSPVIVSLAGPGYVNADTQGGQPVVIRGQQFGPVGTSVGGYLDPSATYGSRQANRFDAVECVVTVAHFQMECRTSPGTGKGHSWQVTVAGVRSSIYHAEMSYAAPVIVGFSDPGAADARTPGGQTVLIEGRQFGNDTSTIDSVWYGEEGPEFEVTMDCHISRPHEEMNCTTSAGAGALLKWVLVIDGQESGAPTTSYKEPSITGVSGAVVASTNGGEEFNLWGANFGPPDKVDFLEAVSYGPSATQYDALADCDVIDHDHIRCLTQPGVGSVLKWFVRVKGQGSDQTPAELFTRYAPPSITNMTQFRGGTIGGYKVTVIGQNFGFSTAVNPERRTSSFALRWDGTDLTAPLEGVRFVDPATSETVKMDANGLVPAGTQHEFVFVVPEATELGATRTVQVVVTDSGGEEVVSEPVTFTYDDPVITNVYPVNNRQSGKKELQVEGRHFGTSGEVIVTDKNGQETTVDCTLDDGDLRESAWTHGFVVCKYSGIKGSVRLHRGDQVSNSFSFEHRAPQIANLESAATPSKLKYFLTEGGEDMTISGYDFAKDAKDLNITVGAQPCVIVGNITSVKEGTDEIVTVHCRVPPGQGSMVPVKIVSFGQPSAGIPINYEVPFVAEIIPREVPTNGGNTIVIKGWNFGVDKQTAFLERPGSLIALDCAWTHREATCVVPEGAGSGYTVSVRVNEVPVITDHAQGRFRHKAAYDDYNSKLSSGQIPVVLAPDTCPPVENLVPSNQMECNARLADDKIPFKFSKPVVSHIVMPAYAHTRGGYTFTVVGENFGHSAAPVTVELKPAAARRLAGSGSGTGAGAAVCATPPPLDTQLILSSHNHTHITVVMPPAAGGAALIPVVTVDGQQSVLDPSSVPAFNFAKPTVQAVSPNHAPTDALTLSGDTVVLNITGDNFGMCGSVCMMDDPNPAHPVSCQNLPVVEWHHRWITVELQASQGQNRRIVVTSGGQSTTDNVMFNFDMPALTFPNPLEPDTSTFLRKADKFPTKGGYEVTIHGTSFGTLFAQVLLGPTSCALVSQTDRAIVFKMPPGIGVHIPFVVWVGTTAYSAAHNVSYDPPRIDYINPYPADAEGEELEIHGANYGAPGTSSALEMLINGEECTRAIVAKGQKGGEDFIKCLLPRQPVGYKNITLTVAEQTVYYKGSNVLKTECQFGFYGQDGERCLPCPRGATCQGGSHPVWTHMEAEPVSDQGWWLKNVTDELSLCPDERLSTRVWLGGNFQPHCPHALPCEPKAACNGSNTCTEGYAGERCSLCAERYYRRAGECVECPDNPLMLVGAFVVALICAAAAGYFLNKKAVNLAFLSIGVDYFQVLALFANSRVTWPPFVKYMFHLMSVFNFNLEITAPECSIPDLGYVTKWVFVMGLPIGVALGCLVAHFALICKKRCIQGRRKNLTAHTNLLVASFMVMFYYMYLYLTRTTLDVFNCAPTDPPDGHEYLEVVFERCDEPGGVHQTLLPFAIATFGAYTLGYPFVLASVLWKNRRLVMEDQLLRAMEVGATRLTNPHAYDLRKKYHKLYYHFKPDFWYWILVVIMRKFLIAFTALMFNKNPAFQLSMALLVMFGAYALQVRNTPYMSMSEHPAVVRDHEHKASDGHPVHMALKTVVTSVAQRGKKASRKFSWNGGAGGAASAAANFFWNYNTVEAVLLACAVLVTLAGIMFESGRFESEYYSTQRDFITVCVILVVMSSLVYFATVLLSEMWTTFCAKPATKKGKGKGKGRRRSSVAGGADAMAQLATNPMQGGAQAATEFNPLFLKMQEGKKEEHTANLIASKAAPDQASWQLIREQYERTQEELTAAKRKIQQYESMRTSTGLGAAAASSSGSGKVRVGGARRKQFAARQAGGARAASGRNRRSSKRRPKASSRPASAAANKASAASSPKPAAAQPAAAAAATTAAAPTQQKQISANEWNQLSPEEQAARRKAYEDWQRQYGHLQQ